MNRSLLHVLPTVVGALLCASTAQAQSNAILGRDIQLQDTWNLRGYTRAGAYPNGAFAMGAWTTCCNPGTNVIPFEAAMSPNHGYIHWIVARETEGRLQQISNWSFVKHTFGSSNDPSPCGNCAGPGNVNRVEVGCSDTYANSQAVNHFDLGPPAEIDPWLGTWNPSCSLFDQGDPPVAPGQACDGVRSLTNTQASALNGTLHNQMRVRDEDMAAANSTFWYQAGYLIPGEAESLRDNNLGSRGFLPTWTGISWSIADTGTFQQGSILQRWSGATVSSASNTGADGRFYVGVKVIGPVEGKYRYEYAVHNRDNKRGLGALRIPICPTANVTGFGFHDVDEDPLNQWVGQKVGSEIVFTGTGNPLRWNSIFNFWFDTDAAPITGSTLSLDQHDLGAGTPSVLVTSTAPGGLYNVNLGAGCGNPNAPALFATRATIGNSAFQLLSTGNPPLSTCAFAYSLQDGSFLAGPGCTIYAADLDSMVTIGLVSASIGGTVTQSLPIPNSPVFEGMHLDVQEVNLAPTGSLFSAFNLSNGLRVRIGSAISACP
ncbi:MAG: hypothetical protein ABL997_05705 [Planctomycetota bacterium]